MADDSSPASNKGEPPRAEKAARKAAERFKIKSFFDSLANAWATEPLDKDVNDVKEEVMQVSKWVRCVFTPADHGDREKATKDLSTKLVASAAAFATKICKTLVEHTKPGEAHFADFNNTTPLEALGDFLVDNADKVDAALLESLMFSMRNSPAAYFNKTNTTAFGFLARQLRYIGLPLVFIPSLAYFLEGYTASDCTLSVVLDKSNGDENAEADKQEPTKAQEPDKLPSQVACRELAAVLALGILALLEKDEKTYRGTCLVDAGTRLLGCFFYHFSIQDIRNDFPNLPPQFVAWYNGEGTLKSQMTHKALTNLITKLREQLLSTIEAEVDADTKMRYEKIRERYSPIFKKLPNMLIKTKPRNKSRTQPGEEEPGPSDAPAEPVSGPTEVLAQTKVPAPTEAPGAPAEDAPGPTDAPVAPAEPVSPQTEASAQPLAKKRRAPEAGTRRSSKKARRDQQEEEAMRTEQFHNDIASQNGLLSDENKQLKEQIELLKEENERHKGENHTLQELKTQNEILDRQVDHFLAENRRLKSLQIDMLKHSREIVQTNHPSICRFITSMFRGTFTSETTNTGGGSLEVEAGSTSTGTESNPPGGEGPAPTAMESD